MLDLMAANLISGMRDSNLRTRLKSVNDFRKAILAVKSEAGNSQALLYALFRCPGSVGDTIRITHQKLHAIVLIIENLGMPNCIIEETIKYVVESLEKAGNRRKALDALSCIVSVSGMGQVAAPILNLAFNLSPKKHALQKDVLQWMKETIEEGNRFEPRVEVPESDSHELQNLMLAVGSRNKNVQQLAIRLLGVMFMYMGEEFKVMIEAGFPALMPQILERMQKYDM